MANALHHFAYAAILHSGMASMCRVEPQYCKIFEEHSLISENCTFRAQKLCIFSCLVTRVSADSRGRFLTASPGGALGNPLHGFGYA